MPTLAEKAVVAKPGRDREQGAGRGMPSLSMRAGPPRRYIKTCRAPCHVLPLPPIADWAQDSSGDSCEVISRWLACFRAVAEVGCSASCGRKGSSSQMNYQKKISRFWGNLRAVLGNLRGNQLQRSFHARKVALIGYLGALPATASIGVQIWRQMNPSVWFMHLAAVSTANDS